MDTQPLVSVKCMTYNQEAYIGQCLEGLVSQKCNFPFEILVHDDASTDRTAEIVREYAEKYPDLIRPIYESENQYSKNCRAHHKAVDPLIRGKYMAICEGDDYWTDPQKLQKEADFLESHPDFGLCYTYARSFEQKSGKFRPMRPVKKIPADECLFEYLMLGDIPIPTVTALFRTDLYRNYLADINPAAQNWSMGDYPIWLYICHDYKAHLIPEETAVYRILPQSCSHRTDPDKQFAVSQSSWRLRCFFSEKYNFPLPPRNTKSIYCQFQLYALLREYTPAFRDGYRKSYEDLPPQDRSRYRRLAYFFSNSKLLFTAFAWLSKCMDNYREYQRYKQSTKQK